MHIYVDDICFFAWYKYEFQVNKSPNNSPTDLNIFPKIALDIPFKQVE